MMKLYAMSSELGSVRFMGDVADFEGAEHLFVEMANSDEWPNAHDTVVWSVGLWFILMGAEWVRMEDPFGDNFGRTN